LIGFHGEKKLLKHQKKENKPIFLSVGYATCHWCHVMEHECFENEEIANIMNKYFINIKVDREERPDVDRVYMNFITSLVGGGWPMSVFLTPDLKPFYGGTYFPPNDDYRYGRPGFPTILKKLKELWAKDEKSLIENGNDIIRQLKEHEEKKKSTEFDFDESEEIFRKSKNFNIFNI